MCGGVGRQALEKIVFESPRVLAIVILPYSDKSLCYHKLNIFCIFVAFLWKFLTSHLLASYENAVPKSNNRVLWPF